MLTQRTFNAKTISKTSDTARHRWVALTWTY